MAPVTRRQLLELGLKLTGAATVLGLAGTACGPTNEMPDAGDDHAPDAGGDAPDAAESTPDAGDTTPDAGDETVDAGQSQACADGAGATISSNHGHAVSLPLEVLQAAGDESVSIQGSSGHDHSINLTAANKATLLAGGTVTLTSSSGASHTHNVTLVCAVG